MSVCGLASRTVQRDLALRLALILEPDRDGFHFPVIKKMRGHVSCVS